MNFDFVLRRNRRLRRADFRTFTGSSISHVSSVFLGGAAASASGGAGDGAADGAVIFIAC